MYVLCDRIFLRKYTQPHRHKHTYTLEGGRGRRKERENILLFTDTNTCTHSRGDGGREKGREGKNYIITVMYQFKHFDY